MHFLGPATANHRGGALNQPFVFSISNGYLALAWAPSQQGPLGYSESRNGNALREGKAPAESLAPMVLGLPGSAVIMLRED